MVTGGGKYKSLKSIENITFSLFFLLFKWKWFNFGRNYISFMSIGAGCWPHHAAGVTAPPRSNSLYLIPSVRQLLLLKLRGPRSAGHRYLSRSATGGKKKKKVLWIIKRWALLITMHCLKSLRTANPGILQLFKNAGISARVGADSMVLSRTQQPVLLPCWAAASPHTHRAYHHQQGPDVDQGHTK